MTACHLLDGDVPVLRKLLVGQSEVSFSPSEFSGIFMRPTLLEA